MNVIIICVAFTNPFVYYYLYKKHNLVPNKVTEMSLKVIVTVCMFLHVILVQANGTAMHRHILRIVDKREEFLQVRSTRVKLQLLLLLIVVSLLLSVWLCVGRMGLDHAGPVFVMGMTYLTEAAVVMLYCCLSDDAALRIRNLRREWQGEGHGASLPASLSALARLVGAQKNFNKYFSLPVTSMLFMQMLLAITSIYGSSSWTRWVLGQQGFRKYLLATKVAVFIAKQVTVLYLLCDHASAGSRQVSSRGC